MDDVSKGKIMRYIKNVLIVVLGACVVIKLIYNVIHQAEIQSGDEWCTLVVAAIMIIALVVETIFENSYTTMKKEIDDYYNSARDAIKCINDDNKDNEAYKNVGNEQNTNDIIELMLLNMKEIKEYYVLSKTMAKRSFLLAVVMCIGGFFIISVSIIAIYITDISIAQSVIPIIGGAIVEVIAGTSLAVYRKALEQLNHYYEALHNNERFLSLVNIVNKLSEDKKSQTYINIINSQLEVLKDQEVYKRQ